jgi:hypothetical protein
VPTQAFETVEDFQPLGSDNKTQTFSSSLTDALITYKILTQYFFTTYKCGGKGLNRLNARVTTLDLFQWIDTKIDTLAQLPHLLSSLHLNQHRLYV